MHRFARMSGPLLCIVAFGSLLAACSEPTSGCPTGVRCSDGAPADNATGETGSDSGATDAAQDVAPDEGIDATLDVINPGMLEVVSIVIDPESPGFVSLNGARETQSFRVLGVRRDGQRVPLPGGTWSLEHSRMGDIANDGTFTSNGVAGGRVAVRVETVLPNTMTAQAMTTLTVRIERSVAVGGRPESAAANFTMPAVTDPARAPVVRYPLDQTVMPNNVAPPDVQWDPNGAMDDWFRIRILKPNALVTGYVRHTGMGFLHDWHVDPAVWRAIAETDLDAPATLLVDRWDHTSRQVVSRSPVTVNLTRGGIYGAVYYWEVEQGRIRRISPDTGANDDIIPHSGRRFSCGSFPVECIACHTVSRNGRWLAGGIGDAGGQGAVYDLTRDLTADPAPSVFPVTTTSARWIWSTFNPSATRLLTNLVDGSLVLIDPQFGTVIPSTGLPPHAVAQPDWSPDGASVAYVTTSATTGQNSIDFTRGDLTITAASGMDDFGPETVLHRGADLVSSPEGGSIDAHPTWSPDSRFIAFGHGTNARSASATTVHPSALYLEPRMGGVPVRLDNANEGPSGRQSHWPTFSPFTTLAADGRSSYVWIAYHSQRVYGNNLGRTPPPPTPCVGAQAPRQLWVSAINLATPAGRDPSSVPYWLPGQNVSGNNMAAYWAAQPCRTNGTDCRTNADCCSGRCNAMGRCEPPPVSMCRRLGATCGSNGDCCAGLMCVGNVCDFPPPG